MTLDGAGYTYDSVGNRTAKTNYLNNITEQYTYDLIYQLTQVTQGTTTTESYSYDAVGNRLSSLGMSPYAYNSSNELTSTPNATFTYDGNGNTLTKSNASGTTQYGWDFENRLTQVVVPGVGNASYRYDPFGRRIQKSGPSGTVNYVYDGANAIEEVDSSENLVARYAQGAGIDEPLGELRSGANAFYEQDGLGSITSLSGLTGTISNSYTYDAFGNASLSGSFINPYRYTARDYDSESGLQYSRARYYSPDTGRFLNEDPLEFGGGSLDFYRYVLNRPINLTDPFGLSWICPSFLPWCPAYQPTPPKPQLRKILRKEFAFAADPLVSMAIGSGLITPGSLTIGSKRPPRRQGSDLPVAECLVLEHRMQSVAQLPSTTTRGNMRSRVLLTSRSPMWMRSASIGCWRLASLRAHLFRDSTTATRS